MTVSTLGPDRPDKNPLRAELAVTTDTGTQLKDVQQLVNERYLEYQRRLLEYGDIHPVCDPETGGNPGHRSEHFYHWGALLGLINLMVYGYF